MKESAEKQKNAYIRALCIYLLCLPLNALSIGSFGSLLKLIAFVPMIIAFIRFRIHRSYKKCVVWQFAYVLFACFSIFWSVEKSLSIDRAITYVLLFLLVFTGTIFNVNDQDIERIKNGFLWSTRTTALVMLLFSSFRQGRWFLSSRISEDPNYLCCYLISGIILLLQRIQTNGRRKLSYIELIVYLVLVVATGSRGGLLAVAAGILVFLFTNKRLTAGELLKKLGIVILIIVAFFVILSFMPSSLQDRFSLSSILASQGVGRYAVWKEAIRVFKEASITQKLLGTGAGTVTSVIRILEYGQILGYAIHNIFLETLIELGIIGLLLYSIAIASFVRASYWFKDKFAFSVIIAMLTLSLSTSLHTFKPYFNIMLFIIIMLYKSADTDDDLVLSAR